MKTNHFLALLFLVLLIAPCSALTVSAVNLKMDLTNVHDTTTNEYFITENAGTAKVAFYDGAIGLCSADPDTLVGNGSIVITCDPPVDSAVGYARISEAAETGAMVSTGVRLPIALSATSSPASEPTQQATQPDTQTQPEPATVAPALTVISAPETPITPAPIQTPAGVYVTITSPIKDLTAGISLYQITAVLLVGFIIMLGFSIGLVVSNRRNKL